MPTIDLEYNEFDNGLYNINKNLEDLEHLYNADVINLELYYQIKGNIIQKLISISKDEIENLKELPWF